MIKIDVNEVITEARVREQLALGVAHEVLVFSNATIIAHYTEEGPKALCNSDVYVGTPTDLKGVELDIPEEHKYDSYPELQKMLDALNAMLTGPAKRRW